jgi:YaiO family outer membrane protein
MKSINHLLILFLFVSTSVFAQTELTEKKVETDKQTNQEEIEKPKYEVQFNYSNENLSKNYGTWHTASLYIQRKFKNKQIVWANYRESVRNSTRDREIIAGTYKPISKTWAVTAEGMVSNTHQYVGKFSVMGEVEKVLKRGFVVHGGTRLTKYEKIKALTGYGIVEKYWGNNRGAYTIYLTNLTDAGTAPTHKIQYNHYYGESVNNFGIGLSVGKEHENLGPNLGVLRSNTWSLTVSQKHWVTKNLGVNVSATIHRQGTIYYRRGINAGLSYRF